MCPASRQAERDRSCLWKSLKHKDHQAEAGGAAVGKLDPLAVLPHCPLALLPVPHRPFIKLKENGRANISRSSSSTSSFSSTAGEGEAMEECDSGVSMPHSTKEPHSGPSWLYCALRYMEKVWPRQLLLQMRAVHEVRGLCLSTALKGSSGGCLCQGCRLVRERLLSWLRQKCQ